MDNGKKLHGISCIFRIQKTYVATCRGRGMLC